MKNKLLNFVPILFAALFVMFAFNSCKDTTTTPEENIELSGNLVDITSNPVSDATIQAIEGNVIISQDSTDEFGAFSLKGIPQNSTDVKFRITAVSFPVNEVSLLDLMKNDNFNSSKKLMIFREDSCKSYISVKTIDSANGNPLSGVQVKIRKSGQVIASGNTNDEGKVNFGNFCAGEYNYRIYKENYYVLEGTIIVGENDTLSKQFSLVKIQQQNCCSQVNVLVKDDSTGTPLANVQVKLAKVGGDYKVLTTNNDGKVTFNEICDGSYWLRIAKDGYQVIETDYFTFQGCDTLDKTFSMKLQAKCCGFFNPTVIDSTSGNPLSGATVKMTKEGWAGASKTTENNGKVSFGELCAGNYFVRISKDGYKVIEDSFTISECDTVKTNYYLASLKDTCCNNILTITPKDSTSKSVINGAVVKLRQNGVVLKTVTIAENQPASFYSLCTGTYSILITAENYPSKEVNYTFTCNQTKNETVYLSKKDSCCNNILKITPKDSTSNAVINGAVVKLRKNGVVLKTVTISENQPAQFNELCTGTYSILIIAENYPSKEINYTFTCDQIKNETIYMAKNETCCDNKLVLTIKDSSNNALQNATVKVWKNGAIVTQRLTTDGGKVTIDSLCTGTYGFDVMKENYESIEFTMTFDCHNVKESTKLLSMVLPCENAKMKFYVKDLDSLTALSGVSVTVKLNDNVIATGTTNNDGVFGKEGLSAPANYVVIFSKDGYQSKTISMKFIDCVTKTETINMQKN